MEQNLELRSIEHVGTFWWVFALRGCFAALFSAVLFTAGNLFLAVYFDPVVLPLLGLFLGFYVMGNGLLLGVAAIVADDHEHHLWWLLLAESIVALALGVYIGFTLLLTPQSLALLAGLHALVAGCFQGILAYKMKHDGIDLSILGVSAAISLCAGIVFLMHQDAKTLHITNWLGALELYYGAILIFLGLKMRRDRLSIARQEN